MLLSENIYTLEISHSDGRRLKLVIPEDSDALEWTEAFKTVMYWLTFHPDTINDVFYSEEEKIEEEKTDE